MIKPYVALISAALLAACSSRPQSDDPALDDLRSRMRTVERKQDNFVARLEQDEATMNTHVVVAPAHPPSLAPRDTYELDRGRAPPIRYPTKERCEEARQVMLDEAQRVRDASEAQGAIYVSPVSIVCVPI